MEVEVDSMRGTKTLIKIVFFVNLVMLIFSFIFENFSEKFVIALNLILLGLQVGMDFLEEHMNNKYGRGNWGVENKYFKGKIR